MKTISVVVAARGAAAWLADCLDSIAAQRLPSGWRAQIVVGIDACPETLAVAAILPIPRLSVLFMPQRVGPYVVFNTAARAHPADVLVRFDADDVMLPGYLESQIAVLDQALSPTIVQTWSIFVDRALTPIAARLSNGTLTPPDGRRTRPSDGQILLTRSVWERLGAFRSWWCHADTEFLVRAAWSGVRRVAVPQWLYLRRVHDESLTRSAATGYDSLLRRRYASEIQRARMRYARGEPPERVPAVIAQSYPCGRAARFAP